MHVAETDLYDGIWFLVHIVGLTNANKSLALNPILNSLFKYFKERFLDQVGTLMTTSAKKLIPEGVNWKNFMIIQ